MKKLWILLENPCQQIFQDSLMKSRRFLLRVVLVKIPHVLYQNLSSALIPSFRAETKIISIPGLNGFF